mmetsp:Transcript_48291/g.122647  ORF Transcript_48291/g.122647 Transcript_48291/m.122647 type:complete len:1113 (-) Transcript_48291:34-3372(-)
MPALASSTDITIPFTPFSAVEPGKTIEAATHASEEGGTGSENAAATDGGAGASAGGVADAEGGEGTVVDKHMDKVDKHLEKHLSLLGFFHVMGQAAHQSEAEAFHAKRSCTDLPFTILFCAAMCLQAARYGEMMTKEDASWVAHGWSTNHTHCQNGTSVVWCLDSNQTMVSECTACPDKKRRSIWCSDAEVPSDHAVLNDRVYYGTVGAHCLPLSSAFRFQAIRALIGGPQGLLFILQQLRTISIPEGVLLNGIMLFCTFAGSFAYLYMAAFHPKPLLFTTLVVPSVTTFTMGCIWIFRDRAEMFQLWFSFVAHYTNHLVLEDSNVKSAMTHVKNTVHSVVNSSATLFNTTAEQIYNTTQHHAELVATQTGTLASSALKVLPEVTPLGGDLVTGLIAIWAGWYLMRLSKRWKKRSAYGIGTCQVAGECISQLKGFWVVTISVALLRMWVACFQYRLIVMYLSGQGDVKLFEWELWHDFFGRGPVTFSIYFFDCPWEAWRILLTIIFVSQWNSNTIKAFERFVFIYASQVWYVHWERVGGEEESDLSWTLFPMLRAFYIGIRYHFGTIAAYALLGQPWEFFRSVLEVLYLALTERQWYERKSRHCVSTLVTKVLACVLRLLKRLISVHPRGSLVSVIMNSDPFFVGSYRAYEVTKNDHMGIIYLAQCSRLFTELGSFSLTFLMMYSAWFLGRKVPLFSLPHSPLYVKAPSAMAVGAFIQGFFVSESVISVLDHVGETILFGWALDRAYRAICPDAQLVHEHPQMPHFCQVTMPPGPPGAGRIFMGPNPFWDEEDEADEVDGRELAITIKSAKGLRAMDENWFYANSSDPYCRCEAVGYDGTTRSSFRTETITRSLEPQWGHNGLITNFQHGDVLTFTLWDDDTVTGDDVIGTATVEDSVLRPFYYFDGELDIDQGPEHPLGKLTVSIRGTLLGGDAFSAPKSLKKLFWCCSCIVSCCETLSWCCTGKTRTFFLVIGAITATVGYVGWKLGWLEAMMGQIMMYVYIGAVGLGIILLALYSLWEMLTGFFDFFSEQLTFLVRVGIGTISHTFGFAVEERWQARRSPLPDEYGMVTLVDDGDFAHNGIIQRMAAVLQRKQQGKHGAYGMLCCQSRR